MASIFLKSFITFFVIFSALSIATAIQHPDVDFIISGRDYYIIQQGNGVGGGLTVSPINLYITQDKDETSFGSPFTIESPFRLLPLPWGVPISILFRGRPLEVIDNGTSKLYVTLIGSKFSNPNFAIENDNGEYKLKYVSDGERKDVGFFKEDGFLGITNEIPFSVRLEEAPNSSNLLMKI